MTNERIDVMSLATQIKGAARGMIEASKMHPGRSNEHQDHTAILFTGNIHHNVPHALLFSTDIGPTEKTIWQLMRALITNNQLASSAPRRIDIAAAVPCTEPTVTKSRYALRVNRWLTFCDRVRNGGRVVGDIYMLHEEPLPLYETIIIDPSYDLFLREVVDSTKRHSKQTVALAQASLDEIAALVDPQQRTHLDGFRERIENRSSYSKIFTIADDTETHEKSVNSALDQHYSNNFSLEHPYYSKNLSLDGGAGKILSHSSSSCSSSSNNRINNEREINWTDQDTVPQHHAVFSAHFPQFKNSRYLDDIAANFLGTLHVLPIVRQQIHALDPTVGQDILYQLIAKMWRTRTGEPAVRNITGYVAGLIKKVSNQNFHLDDYGAQVKHAVENDDPSNLIGLLSNWRDL